MARTTGYTWTVIARRVAARTVRHIIRDPIVLLALTCLAAILVLGGPGATPTGELAADADATDAAERYMRGMRDRDVGEVFASLSPEMRRSLEQRAGLLGPAAVAAVFQEQERRGERTIGYRLVARYDTIQGDELRFYVVQAQRGDERREIPYVLTLAPDGTVARVE